MDETFKQNFCFYFVMEMLHSVYQNNDEIPDQIFEKFIIIYEHLFLAGESFINKPKIISDIKINLQAEKPGTYNFNRFKLFRKKDHNLPHKYHYLDTNCLFKYFPRKKIKYLSSIQKLECGGEVNADFVIYNKFIVKMQVNNKLCYNFNVNFMKPSSNIYLSNEEYKVTIQSEKHFKNKNLPLNNFVSKIFLGIQNFDLNNKPSKDLLTNCFSVVAGDIAHAFSYKLFSKDISSIHPESKICFETNDAVLGYLIGSVFENCNTTCVDPNNTLSRELKRTTTILKNQVEFSQKFNTPPNKSIQVTRRKNN